MNVEETKKVTIDFSDKALPKSVETLRPLVYLDAGQYHCLLGKNLSDGILGIGKSTLSSIIDWDTQLTARLATATEDDEVIQYVKETYKAQQTEVW